MVESLTPDRTQLKNSAVGTKMYKFQQVMRMQLLVQTAEGSVTSTTNQKPIMSDVFNDTSFLRISIYKFCIVFF